MLLLHSLLIARRRQSGVGRRGSVAAAARLEVMIDGALGRGGIVLAVPDGALASVSIGNGAAICLWGEKK